MLRLQHEELVQQHEHSRDSPLFQRSAAADPHQGEDGFAGVREQGPAVLPEAPGCLLAGANRSM